MNTLSWLIYLIQIISTMHFAAGFLLFMGIFAFGMIVLGSFIHDDFRILRASKKYFIMLFVACSIITIFVPNRQTMILIASSEVGEKIINSKSVQDMIDPSVTLLR